MLLVLFNAIVMGLLVVVIIQGYEIKNLRSEINKIKLVQVVTALKGSNVDFKTLKETAEKLKESVKSDDKDRVD